MINRALLFLLLLLLLLFFFFFFFLSLSVCLFMDLGDNICMNFNWEFEITHSNQWA